MPLKSDSVFLRECPLSRVARPGVMISNAWPQSRRTEGATLRAIEEVLENYPDFEAYQTVDVPFAAERRAIRRLLGNQGHPHTYTLTRIFAEQKASLSSLDPDNRRRAVTAVIPQLDDALEIGADRIFVVSGARPTDPNRREEALAVLGDSLGQLAHAASNWPSNRSTTNRINATRSAPPTKPLPSVASSRRAGKTSASVSTPLI